ncbi:EHMT2-like protein [Mya arenaria]|uniref:EHMT2-like protein n=1 Tax=Mya arenaria TaxID=6604 RepID=A0ABY7EJL2_MYAAR|nr:EHMT2-like protein [Mya arenaria]
MASFHDNIRPPPSQQLVSGDSKTEPPFLENAESSVLAKETPLTANDQNSVNESPESPIDMDREPPGMTSPIDTGDRKSEEDVMPPAIDGQGEERQGGTNQSAVAQLIDRGESAELETTVRSEIRGNDTPKRGSGRAGSPHNADDGGWLTHRTRGSNEKQKQSEKGGRVPRAILQKPKESRNTTPRVVPDPLSISLVLQNGRIPAAKQQSTLFRDNKQPKASPRVQDAQNKGKTGRGERESPLPNKGTKPYRSVLQTTLRGDAPRTRKEKGKTQKPKLSKSECHYVRLCKMVSRVGSDLLRLVLYRYLESQQPSRRLPQFLATNRRRLLGLQPTNSLLQKRWAVLFPEDESKASLEQFDSALLFFLLRYICNLRRHNDFLWKRKPAADDLTEAGEIARLRDIRNFLVNLSCPALYEDEFDRKVHELKQVTLRVCGERRADELLRVLDEMRTEAVRFPERDQYLDALNQWADETGDRHIGDFRSAPAQQAGETTRERIQITRRFLEHHRNPRVFVKTRAVTLAKQKLMKNGFVILKGNIGDGKTTAAVALLVSQFDEDECALLAAPDQWLHVEPRAVSAVLVDDMLGSGSLDEDRLNAWESKFDWFVVQMHTCSKPSSQMYERCQAREGRAGVRLVITARHHILDKCWPTLSKYRLFARDNIVDCSSAELTFMEKRSMLGRHIVDTDVIVTKTEIDKAARVHSSRLGFPQCCALFVSREQFMLNGSQFFERPIEILFEALDQMYNGDKYGYLALVLLMFQKDAILFVDKLKEFTDVKFRVRVLDLAFLCKIPLNDRINTFIIQALQNQLSSFVDYYADRNCYTFAHESIMESITASFGERHPQEVLEGCAMPFLMDFVGTDGGLEERPEEIFMMRVFVHNIIGGEARRISQHRAMKDPRFLDFFFDYLKDQPDSRKIILAQDKHTTDPMDQKRKVGLLYGAIDQDVSDFSLVSAILKLGAHTSNDSGREQWCRGELQAALCLAVTRGSYEVYKLLADAGVELPDALMEEEQYLVSVNIVRDILSRRYWSDEQKDVAVVKASRGRHAESHEVVTLLLQDSASPNSIRAGSTALCEAVKSGKLKNVQLLLSSGSSVDDRDGSQQTPLHHATDWNNIEVIKVLLKKNADVNARDALGFTPLLVAAGWGRETALELLVARRPNVLAMDDQENTILHITAANGRTAVMKMMFDKYPKEMESILIARNRHGWTPLDFALRCGHLGVTRLLISTILRKTGLKADARTSSRTFVHTRFFVVKLEDFSADERYQYRFLSEGVGRTCFQMPRCTWFIQAGNRDEYEEVRLFALKYENKLRQCLAKS